MTILYFGVVDNLFSVHLIDNFFTVPPVIDNSHLIDELSAVVGSTVLFDCPAEGVPPPRITWMRNNRPLSVYTNPNLQLLDDDRCVFAAA